MKGTIRPRSNKDGSTSWICQVEFAPRALSAPSEQLFVESIGEHRECVFG